jgi:hypothetical protein
VKHKIPFNVAVQNPGDLIVADGTSAHQGWNAGNNLASAANYLDHPSLVAIWEKYIKEDGTVRFPCVCGETQMPSNGSQDSDGVWWYDPLRAAQADTNTCILGAIRNLGEKFAKAPYELERSSDPKDQMLYKLWHHFYGKCTVSVTWGIHQTLTHYIERRLDLDRSTSKYLSKTHTCNLPSCSDV